MFFSMIDLSTVQNAPRRKMDYDPKYPNSYSQIKALLIDKNYKQAKPVKVEPRKVSIGTNPMTDEEAYQPRKRLWDRK